MQPEFIHQPNIHPSSTIKFPSKPGLPPRDFSTATDFNPSNNGAHYRIGESQLFGCQYQKVLDKFDTSSNNETNANVLIFSRLALAIF